MALRLSSLAVLGIEGGIICAFDLLGHHNGSTERLLKVVVQSMVSIKMIPCQHTASRVGSFNATYLGTLSFFYSGPCIFYNYGRCRELMRYAAQCTLALTLL